MLSNLPQYIAYVRKAIVQIVGLATALLALGLLPDKYAALCAAAIGVLTTILHFLTPNGNAPGTAPAVEDDWAEDEDEGAEVPDEFKPASLVTASQVAADHQIAAPPSDV